MSYGAGERRREAESDVGPTRLDRRLADLEAQVARLEAALAAMGSATSASAMSASATSASAMSASATSASAMSASRADTPADSSAQSGPDAANRQQGRYDRRALMRRGGYVIAGAAGAAALPALTACGDGSNFLLGRANVAQSPTTLNRSVSSATPTLILGSSAPAAANPQLRLSPLFPAPPATTQPGDLFVQAGSTAAPALLYFTHQPRQGSVGAAVGTVYTDFLANLFVPVSQLPGPGYAGPRAFSGTVDATHTPATIDLSRFLAADGLAVAVVGTLSVSEPSGAGFATVSTPPTAPSIPHVSWPAAGAASALVVAVPADSGGQANRLLVAITPPSVSAMVRFEVAGFFVPSPANLAAAALAPSVAGASQATRAQAPRSFGQVLGR